MSSSIEAAEKDLEDLAIERFKLLLQIQKEIRIGEVNDENILTSIIQLKNEQEHLRGYNNSEIYFVSGFDDTTTKEDLSLYFNEYGIVTGVRMKKKSIKFALVYFDSVKDQIKMEKKIHFIKGKRIYLSTNQEDGENALLLSGFQVKFVRARHKSL